MSGINDDVENTLDTLKRGSAMAFAAGDVELAEAIEFAIYFIARAHPEPDGNAFFPVFDDQPF